MTARYVASCAALLLTGVVYMGCGELAADSAKVALKPAPAVAKVLSAVRPFRAPLSTTREWIECSAQPVDSTENFKCDLYQPDLAALARAGGALTSGRVAVPERTWSSALLDLASSPDDARLEAIIRDLEILADSSGSPAARNDLVVARLLSYERHKDGLQILAALNDVERAFHDDSLSEVIAFNRALVLHAMRLYEETSMAVRDLPKHGGRAASTNEIDFTFKQLRAGRMIAVFDTAAPDLAVAASRDPQGARDRVLDYYLSKWVESAARHDEDDANNVKSSVASIGSALLKRSGDSSVSHIAAELDARDPATVAAVQSYVRGYGQFRLGSYGGAIGPLQNASLGFRRARKPALDGWNAITLAASHVLSGSYAIGDSLNGSVRTSAARRGDIALEARSSWGLALSAARRQQSTRALVDYRRAEKLFADIGELGNRSAMLSQAADVSFVLGQDDASLNDKLNALDVLERRRNPSLRAGPVLGLADQASALGLPYAQIAVLHEAVLSAKNSERLPDHAEALTRLARAQVLTRRVREAEITLAAAVKARELTKDTVMANRLAIELLSVGAAIKSTADPKAAADLLDREANFYRVRKLKFNLPTPLVNAAELRLAIGDTVAAMRALAEAVDIVEAQVGKTADGKALRDLALSRGRLFNQLAALRIAQHDTIGAFLLSERARGNRLLLLPALPANELHVAYTVLPGELVAWVVRDSSLQMARVPITSDSLASLAEEFVRMTHTDAGNVRTVVLSRRLHALLIESLPSHVAKATAFTVTADGALARVPFATLMDASGRYLVERAAITYAPQVRANAKVVPSGTAALIIGDPAFSHEVFPALRPLTAALREADDVAATYRLSRVLKSEAATKMAVLSALPGVGIFHFAGHAQLVERVPAQSHLVVASNSADVAAGSITAAEIGSLNLKHVRLVVLSSCGTSQMSRGVRASVQNSLANAFLTAGAKGVVSSGWQADDAATAALMRNFYLELKSVASPAVALQRAQVGMIRERGRGGANLWGGFRYEVR